MKALAMPLERILGKYNYRGSPQKNEGPGPRLYMPFSGYLEPNSYWHPWRKKTKEPEKAKSPEKGIIVSGYEEPRISGYLRAA